MELYSAAKLDLFNQRAARSSSRQLTLDGLCCESGELGWITENKPAFC